MEGAIRVLITGCTRVGNHCRVGGIAPRTLFFKLTDSPTFLTKLGIGRALVRTYLLRPDYIVIAAVRNPEANDSATLRDLPTGEGSKLIVLQIDSASEQDPFLAVQVLQERCNIHQLDIVIANAGISKYFGRADVTPATEMIDHYKVNVLGPLLLFQATAPLLLRQGPTDRPRQPKFVTVSSGAGSIQGIDQLKVENTAYGSSKAALNFVTRRIHSENEGLIAFPINPGWLQTELGNHAASSSGMAQAPVSIEDGVAGIMRVIDTATREATSGCFISADGSQLAW